MTADVRTFVPRADKSAQENLKAFIALGREMKPFGPNIAFDALQWDTNATMRGHGTKRFRISFCNHLTAGPRKKHVPLQQPFGDFARAYIAYMQARRPVNNQQHRMTALRVTEEALLRVTGAADPIRVDQHVLNVAVEVHFEAYRTPEGFKPSGTCYRVGQQLELLAQFITENQLVSVPVGHWHSSISRDADPNIRFGPEFEARREEKLPDQEALEALTVAFQQATATPDVIVTSCAGLLVLSPERINEALTLSVHCQREVFHKPSQQLRYGLVWPGSKGFKDAISWFKAEDVALLAKECLRRLIEVTEPAREIARWYEENAGKLFLPASQEHLRQEEYISAKDFATIIGSQSTRQDQALAQWCKKRSIPLHEVGGSKQARFADIEAAIVRMLPENFPVLDERTGLKYSDALFLVRKYEMSDTKGMHYNSLFEPVTINQINDGLGARAEHRISSVFQRLGLKNSKGDYHRITTHQFRHYLNTIAHLGGVPDLLIALWSKRADIRQNAHYDHVASGQIREKLKGGISNDLQLPEPFKGIRVARRPIARSEFLSQVIPAAAHVTDFGWCTHDYGTSPCETFRDCINCDEQLCIKGVKDRLENIQRAIEETAFLLDRARADDKDGTFGATRWAEHQEMTLERMAQLEAILTSDAIPDGTPVRLKMENSATLLRAAIEERHVRFGDVRLMESRDRERGDAVRALPVKLTRQWEIGTWEK